MRMMPTIPAGLIVASLQRSAALDQLDDQHHNSNHEEEVNEAAERVGADQSKKPEHKQDHKYCPEHKVSFRLSLTLLRARRFRCAYRNKNFCSLGTAHPPAPRFGVASRAVATTCPLPIANSRRLPQADCARNRNRIAPARRLLALRDPAASRWWYADRSSNCRGLYRAPPLLRC